MSPATSLQQPCQSQARNNRYEIGEGVEDDVVDIINAVGRDRLDPFVEPAQRRSHRHGESGW